MIRLTVGRKSDPRALLIDTTGLQVAEECPISFLTVEETLAAYDKNNAKPEPGAPAYGSRWAECTYDVALAQWNKNREQVADDAADNADKRCWKAAVWIGPRYFGVGDNTEDNATFVHETVEEIVYLIRATK